MLASDYSMNQSSGRTSNGKTKVLVVDDSALIRQLLTEILSSDPAIEVVGGAADAFIARDKIKILNPDVVTLDVEMPRMNGLQFLRNLMRLRPMPVVMISTYTQEGSETTIEALELGAVDFIAKPALSHGEGLEEYADDIRSKVKVAAQANIKAVSKPQSPAASPAPSASGSPHLKNVDRNKIIAIGASTGGTEAVKDVLSQLPAEMPGILITQHIPASFSTSFARRLNEVCALTVKEADDGDLVLPGHAYVAPGHSHMALVSESGGYRIRLLDSAPVNHHRPSVEVLFDSVKKAAGKNAIAVMLTGMGSDGAQAMADLHATGSFTIAQDEDTSVVWGMPGSAVRLGAADEVLGLNDIPGRLISAIKGK